MEKLTFKDLEILPELKKAVVEMGYQEMTPIQEMAIPHVLNGHDVLAQAPTGTGKTCSFALPAINMINTKDKKVQVLVLCPTRELAIQVAEEFEKLLVFLPSVKVLSIYGGQGIERQISKLREKPQIIVGTPGRIMDHQRRKTLSLENIKLLVLDEADEMLNMGFKEDLDTILASANADCQKILFSATMPKPILKIANMYLKDPQSVKTLQGNLAVPNIKQYYVEIRDKNKEEALCRMIDTFDFKQALVFCRTKKRVDDLQMALTTRGFMVEALHGDLKQVSRDKVMEKFKSGLVSVLIATDVAARGLDISGIDVVFNHDIADDLEYYTHRIGRTARAGRDGMSITFVNKKEASKINDFAKALKVDIEKTVPPSYEKAEAAKISHRMNEATTSLKEENPDKYKGYILAALEENKEFEILDYAAALFRKVSEKDRENIGNIDDIAENFQQKKAKQDFNTDFASAGYVKLFINLGKKDNINKRDLADMFVKFLRVSNKDVKDISILNTFSFVQLKGEHVKKAIKILNEKYFYNRKIAVEVKADKETSTSSKKRR